MLLKLILIFLCQKYSHGASNIQGLMYGGEQATFGQYPWIAPLFFAREGDYFCGSTIISERHLLTAAHCMYSGEHKIHKSSFYAQYGGLNISNSNDSWKRQNISKIFVHPNYIPLEHANSSTRRFDYDIAVLETVDNFDFSKNTKKIRLPSLNANVFNVEGYVVGYGLTENSVKREDIPKFIKIPSVDQVKCFLHHSDYVTIGSERTFCAGSPLKIPCRGDSGGGFYVEEDNTFKVFGIVSSGLSINEMCDSSKYVIFTNVALYLDWIYQILGCYNPQCESFDKCEMVNGTALCFEKPKFKKHYPTQIKVQQGSSINLLCEASGIPQPNITIFKVGSQEPINDDTKFTFSNVSEVNSTYECVAENLIQSVKMFVDVTVVDAPKITSDFDNITINYLKAKEINCDATGLPKPEVQWILNNKIVISENSTILLNSKSESGFYKCVAKNSEGSDEKGFYAQITSPLKIINANLGDEKVLECSSRDEETKFVWIKNGKRLEGDEETKFVWIKNGKPLKKQITSLLTLNNISPDNFGAYLCVAFNNYATTTQEFELNQFEPPKILQPTEDKIILNDDPTLTCIATGNPMPNFFWSKYQKLNNFNIEKLPEINGNYSHYFDRKGKYIKDIFDYIFRHGLSGTSKLTKIGKKTFKFEKTLETFEEIESFTCHVKNSIGQTSKTVEVVKPPLIKYYEWSDWSECNGETQYRTRHCEILSKITSKMNCHETFQIRPCVSEWTAWTECYDC